MSTSSGLLLDREGGRNSGQKTREQKEDDDDNWVVKGWARRSARCLFRSLVKFNYGIVLWPVSNEDKTRMLE